MKIILYVLLLIPFSLFASEKKDSIIAHHDQIVEQFKNLETNLEINKEQFAELNRKLDIQENLNEKTINGISSQLSAASYNLTVFGILFAIAAIILGVYITRIENKVVRLSEENKSLLNQTKINKEEVVAINNLIQKDIFGLYLKIKREETIHLLNRLYAVPQDITNLLELIISRDLEKEDFKILKKTYLKVKDLPAEPRALFSTKMTYNDSYKLVFFQHFLDLAVMDKDIGNDFISFYSTGITCSFENDIIKSTGDFIKAIMDMGYQSKKVEISSFIKGLSISRFKDDDNLYKIIFDGIKNKHDQFNFFNLISEEKECLIGKSNYGKQLINNYSPIELNEKETEIIEKAKNIIDKLEKEKQERQAAEAEKTSKTAAKEQKK